VQAEFAHAARVSMLGELTASIAHEVNQPLAALRTNGETALRWLDRSEPNVPKARELMRRLLDDAVRAAAIVARIRAMAAGQAPRQTALALHDVISESMLFLRHELQSKGVSVSLDLTPALPEVTGDRTQLQQVVVNLAINAVQAMAQSAAGRRRISIRTMLSDPQTVTASSRTAARESTRRISRIFSIVSSPPRMPAWAWACRSRAPLSKRMTATFERITNPLWEEPASALTCRRMGLRQIRPLHSCSLRRFSIFGGRAPRPAGGRCHAFQRVA
jgi:hypothetical protein